MLQVVLFFLAEGQIEGVTSSKGISTSENLLASGAEYGVKNVKLQDVNGWMKYAE